MSLGLDDVYLRVVEINPRCPPYTSFLFWRLEFLLYFEFSITRTENCRFTKEVDFFFLEFWVNFVVPETLKKKRFGYALVGFQVVLS